VSGSRLLSDEVLAAIGTTASYRAPEPLGLASFRYFSEAIGDPNPAYRDPVGAHMAGWPEVIAPPTLLCETNQYTDLRRNADGYAGHTWDLPWPEPVTLIRGGNDYAFIRPAVADDVICVEWRLVELAAKADFVVATSEAIYTNQHRVRLVVNREYALYRPTAAPRPLDGSRSSTPVPAPPLDGEGAQVGTSLHTLELADLVAYAGAAWDWHRLHYDEAFARSHGLAGVVADGQLIGALLASHAHDATGPRSVLTRLAFRNRAPVYAGDTVRCIGRVTERNGPLVTLIQQALVGERLVATATAEAIER